MLNRDETNYDCWLIFQEDFLDGLKSLVYHHESPIPPYVKKFIYYYRMEVITILIDLLENLLHKHLSNSKPSFPSPAYRHVRPVQLIPTEGRLPHKSHGLLHRIYNPIQMNVQPQSHPGFALPLNESLSICVPSNSRSIRRDKRHVRSRRYLPASGIYPSPKSCREILTPPIFRLRLLDW
jgi:hypothetical protein